MGHFVATLLGTNKCTSFPQQLQQPRGLTPIKKLFFNRGQTSRYAREGQKPLLARYEIKRAAGLLRGQTSPKKQFFYCGLTPV